jgi:formylglycine-generating enzyme required for sulfatase activity
MIRRTAFFQRAIFLAVVLSGFHRASVIAAEPAEFFRISGAAGSEITGFSEEGIITWNSSEAPTSFLIERSFELRAGEWAPITRGTLSNQTWSVKVQDPATPARMVFIPGGQFTQGDIFGDIGNLARPVHQTVVSPFFIGRYEVTNDEVRTVYQWAHDQGLIEVVGNSVLLVGQDEQLMPLNPSFPELSFSNGVFSVRTGRGNFPVCYITWFGSVAYCNFLSLMEGREVSYNLADWTCDFNKQGYRLPTEAEWEIAARGGHEGTRFPWSDSNEITHSRANYRSSANNIYDVSPTRDFHPDYANTRPRSSPVGTFAPNGYGLYDMCGNVWEWVWDWSVKYPSAIQYDPVGPETGIYRVFRGGSWYTTAERVIAAARYRSSEPSDYIEDVGLRILIPHRP